MRIGSVRREALFLLLAVVAAWLASFSSSAQAQGRTIACRVADPTGTLLNVRVQPNGTIVGRLPNGSVVAASADVVTPAGRVWTRIRHTSPDGAVVEGWVFGDFLDCRS